MLKATVALPVSVDHGTLHRAFACVADQTLREIEILLVLNGSDAATTDLAHELAADERVRVLELPEANLAAALNLAIEQANSPLLARMDADDTCPAHRLAVQTAHMEHHPELAGLGCAWELADETGRVIEVHRPPTSPARLRWRLLLGNVLAHGSMMLRIDAIRAMGGYDERLDRAQDYDLWLRLKDKGLACLPDVLYRHHTRRPDDPWRSSRAQADVVAPRLLDAWRNLEPGHDHTLTQAIASLVARQGSPAAVRDIEHSLDEHGPSREKLMAWLWASWMTPPGPRDAYDVARLARVREVGRAIKETGAAQLRLWGAGEHTRWLLEHRHHLGVEIVGIVDDHPPAQSPFKLPITTPDHLQPGDCVLISSDWHEPEIWASSAPHRARGVNVWRLYWPDPQ